MKATTNTPLRRHHWRWFGRAAAVLALLLVFLSYLQPGMMMQMAQQIWSCF